MKYKIIYINGNITTQIESNFGFEDFCISFFKDKIYVSIAKNGVSVAINTDNVLLIEEI